MKELASSLKKTLTLFITFIAADDDWLNCKFYRAHFSKPKLRSDQKV